jgi:oligoendopeptidase F
MKQSPEKNSYSQKTWSLKDLYAGVDDPALEKAFKSLEKEVKALESQRPIFTADITESDFLAFIKKLESVQRRVYRLGGYDQILFAQDTQNQVVQTLLARVDQFGAELSNRLLFFTLWWKDLPIDAAGRLLKVAGDYTYWLEQIRLFKPYTLTEAEEKILNIKNVTGFNALNTLYDSITNRYTFNLKGVRGGKGITRGELMVYVRESDPDVRARAYQELYRVFTKDAPILGQMYQTLVRDWANENVSLRKYKAPISTRNLVNDIPDKVVDTLLDVSRGNNAIFQRFFQLKARWIRMNKLRRYDIYAPVAKSDKKYSFAQSTRVVFDAFRQFDPQFEQLADRVFREDHLDGEVRKGKMGGAFCLTVEPSLTPWVLLNYQGKSDDVATMAHELGHAIHAMMAEHHTLFTQHACLPLAETASTFGEMLLVDKLLKEETDESVRRDLLFRQMDDSYATIQRQIYFALFEKQAHGMVMQNASVDDLAAAYFENLKEQFGDSVELNEEFKWEWVAIPHIYNVPFYVYAYAFGQLLVLSLYRQFKLEGESFKPRFRRILSTGGSEAPVKLLKHAGVDITKASFWQGGFDVLDELVKQLEAIPVK